MPVKTKLLTAACALTFAFYASAASAAPTVIINPGSGKLPSYTTAQIFETFDNGFNPASRPARTGSLNTGGGFQEYVVGGQASLVAGELNPDDSASSQVLNLASGAELGVSFGQPQQFFSIEYASVGGYATFQFFTADNNITILVESLSPNGRISFDFGGAAGINQVRIDADRGSIDFDNIAAAVPETATWTMMIFGMGAIGFAMRRRNLTTRVSYAV